MLRLATKQARRSNKEMSYVTIRDFPPLLTSRLMNFQIILKLFLYLLILGRQLTACTFPLQCSPLITLGFSVLGSVEKELFRM